MPTLSLPSDILSSIQSMTLAERGQLFTDLLSDNNTAITLASNTSLAKSKSSEDTNELIYLLSSGLTENGMVYQSDPRDRKYAYNLLRMKAIRELAEKHNTTTLGFLSMVIKIQFSDRFWSGKINNCVSLYYNYAKVYNECYKKYQASQPIIL